MSENTDRDELTLGGRRLTELSEERKGLDTVFLVPAKSEPVLEPGHTPQPVVMQDFED